MDKSYVTMLAVAGYPSIRLDDVHNAKQSAVYQRQPAALRLSLNRENSWRTTSRQWQNNSGRPTQVQVRHQSGNHTFTTQDAVVSQEAVSIPTTPSQYSIMKTPPSQQQMVLWIYSDPTKLYLIPVTRSNPVAKLKEFIESRFQIGIEDYTLANLSPGASYPVPLMKFSNDLDNGVILCLPNNNINLSIQNSMNDHQFKVQINPLQTVRDLKMLISKSKGYPLNQQELLYNNHAMQNQQQILDHQLKDGSKLYLVLQPSKPFAIILDTFWGQKYQLDVHSCMTLSELVQKVLRAMFDDPMKAEQLCQKFSTISHLFHLQYNEQALDLDQCLGFYNIRARGVVKLQATSEARHDNTRRFDVLVEDREEMTLTGAVYDTWFILLLKVYGRLKVPIDKMSLYVNDHHADVHGMLSEVDIEDNFVTVRIIKDRQKQEFDLHNEVIAEIKLPNGRIQSIRCQQKDHISKVKENVVKSGFQDAQLYDLLYKKVRLPANSKVMDYKFPEKVELEMRLYEFPVFLKQTKNSYHFNVDCDRPVSDLIQKITDKVTCSPIKTALVHCGNDLFNIQPSYIRNTSLFINSTIHMESEQALQIVHLVSETEVMPLPTKPTLDPLHLKQLALTCYDVESFLESFQWFIKWRFPERSRIHGVQFIKRSSHRRHKTSSGTGLHQTLQAVRDGLKSQGAAATSPSPNRDSLEPSNKLFTKFLEGLSSAKFNDKGSRTGTGRLNQKLPQISAQKDRQSSLGGRSSTNTLKSAKSADTLKDIDSETSESQSRKKRSVRFDIPENEGNATNRTADRNSSGSSRSVWQDSKTFLDKQAKQNSNGSPQIEMVTRAQVHSDRRHKNPQYRAFQSFPIPKWHQSQMPMHPNFTNNIVLNGSKLNTISIKPASAATTT